MKRLGLSELILAVALDRKSLARLNSLAVATIYRPHDCSDLGGLWIHRLRIIHELMSNGPKWIVHSDSDAVWLQNPLPDWETSGFTLLFTQGTVWPQKAFESRGFVACCGCSFILNTPTSRDFMRKAVRKCEEVNDDQQAINMLLPLKSAEWQIESGYEIEHQLHRITASHSIMRTHSDNLAVGILPHREYPRLMAKGPVTMDAKIAHPISPKHYAQTIETLKSHSLWYL